MFILLGFLYIICVFFIIKILVMVFLVDVVVVVVNVIIFIDGVNDFNLWSLEYVFLKVVMLLLFEVFLRIIIGKVLKDVNK